MKKHILIVEDSIPAMFVEKMLMKNLNCKVDGASNAKDAIELVKKNNTHYDLILMDLGLPDMDGIEASKIIRKYENNEHINKVPIVAVTGNADPTQHQACLDIGMNEVIVKPLTKEIANSILLKYT